VLGERVRTGSWVVLALFGGALIAAGTVLLAHSPLFHQGDDDSGVSVVRCGGVVAVGRVEGHIDVLEAFAALSFGLVGICPPVSSTNRHTVDNNKRNSDRNAQ